MAKSKSALDSKRKQKKKEEKKQTRKKKRKYLWLRLMRDLILVALVVVLSIGGYHFFYDVFADVPVASSEATSEDITVRVDSGMSDLAVAKMLKKSGLVENAYVFFAQVKIFADSGSSIQPGTYQLNTYMNGQEIIEVLTQTEEEEEE